MSSQLRTMLTGGILIILIIWVISLLTFLLDLIKHTELSDQSGWKNFRRPIIGIAFFGVALLGIILVILLLLGIF